MTSEHKPSIALFIVFGLLIAGATWFFSPDKAIALPLSDAKSKPALSTTPKVIVREDTLISLVYKFLSGRNANDPGSIKSSGKYFKIVVRKTGDTIEFINNPELMDVKNQGFEIKKNQDGSIEATFTRLSEGSEHYVELPTDILYRLLDNLN